MLQKDGKQVFFNQRVLAIAVLSFLLRNQPPWERIFFKIKYNVLLRNSLCLSSRSHLSSAIDKSSSGSTWRNGPCTLCCYHVSTWLFCLGDGFRHSILVILYLDRVLLPEDAFWHEILPVLVVLNKLVKTFGKKSNLKFGLNQTLQLH